MYENALSGRTEHKEPASNVKLLLKVFPIFESLLIFNHNRAIESNVCN